MLECFGGLVDDPRRSSADDQSDNPLEDFQHDINRRDDYAEGEEEEYNDDAEKCPKWPPAAVEGADAALPLLPIPAAETL